MKTNSKYGFGSSSIYTNIDGEQVNIQIQYLKQEIAKYDVIITDLRKQLQQYASQRESGVPINSVDFQAATTKLADAINQQTMLKQRLDATNVQREIVEQDKIAAAQSGAISNKLGVNTPQTQTNVSNNLGIVTKPASEKSSAKGIFSLLIIVAAVFGVYKLIKK